tara:strand:- start:920 stop:1114 length:195 start_codon:yes stop_codon:yes gene_type:complete
MAKKAKRSARVYKKREAKKRRTKKGSFIKLAAKAKKQGKTELLYKGKKFTLKKNKKGLTYFSHP